MIFSILLLAVAAVNAQHYQQRNVYENVWSTERSRSQYRHDDDQHNQCPSVNGADNNDFHNVSFNQSLNHIIFNYIILYLIIFNYLPSIRLKVCGSESKNIGQDIRQSAQATLTIWQATEHLNHSQETLTDSKSQLDQNNKFINNLIAFLAHLIMMMFNCQTTERLINLHGWATQKVVTFRN